MGNYSEFRRVVDLLKEKKNFDADINVSVFETNIRIVGGLLSAHLMLRKANAELEPGWPCNGHLLRLAEDVAKRLLPAFNTKTGMPYGTINLRFGVPPKETTITSTAGIGTYIVEFGTLSRLTGDPVYEETALNALYALFDHRSPIGLFGNHVDIQTAQDAGIGSGIDSYYEYLVKGAILLNRPELMVMFNEGRKAIDKYLKKDDWFVWVSMNKGQVTLPVFQSLEAFYPGVLSLIGDTNEAMRSLHNYHSVWKQYGFLPEFYNIPNGEAANGKESYPLRPEHIESAMILYRATGDPFLLEVGEDALRSFQYSAKTECGYATIKNVKDHRKEDRMESFFLAETLKYLYLLFDPDNFLHNDGREGVVIKTPNGECVIESGGYIFNTEAHPMDPSALRCCYEIGRDYPLEEYDPNIVVGERFIEKPRKKKVEKPKTSQPDVVVEQLGITLAELQEFLENAEKLTELEKKALDTNQNVSQDDSIILAVESQRNENSKKTNSEDILPDVLKKRLEKIKTQLKSTERNNLENSQIISKESNDNTIDSCAVLSDVPHDNVAKISPARDAANPSATPNKQSNYSPRLDTQEKNSNELDNNYTINYKNTLANNTSQVDSNIIEEKSKIYLTNLTEVDDTTNNSVFHEFVQSIIKVTGRSNSFDPQSFLEHIRTNGVYRNESWSKEYRLLRCKAQPFWQRMSVLGQFFY
uniref:alpha-1,2-Mannosidase n=1 Tax=Culicoides sonorensis TaxID=179676 RepID=A0A336LII2_CULSO